MEINKKEMAIRVSILYYEKNKNQNEIAEELDISRSYVSQLLTYAKEAGMVKITINVDECNLRMIRREIEFKSRFPNLKQVLIMSSESTDFSENNIGKFAAPYITEMINESNVVGVNLGASVEKTIDRLEKQNFSGSGKKVVQIMGELNNNNLIGGAHPNELVKNLSIIMNCPCYYLICPAIIEQPALRLELLKEKSIETVINLWDQIDLAIMGIGVADDRSRLFKLFNDNMIAQIRENNVSCDLTINFFNKAGQYIPLMDNHKISIPYEKLKKIKKKVVICYGGYKNEAILSALNAGMIDILITDSITIQAVERIMGS